MDETEGTGAADRGSACNAELGPVVTERDRLRAAQAKAVMPLIGPLLDAWEGCSQTCREELPELDKELRRINRAMKDFIGKDAMPAQKPLAHGRLARLAAEAQIAFCLKSGGSFEEEFARAIERAHGIGA